MDDVSNEERQALEIEMLQAIYPTEFVLETHSSGPKRFEIRVQDKITLNFTLPKTYPTDDNPIVFISASSLSKDVYNSLQSKLNDLLASLASKEDEVLHEIIDAFISWIPVSSPEASTEDVTHPVESASSSPNFIVLIWFHHMLSTTKRKNIIALESVRGLSKPGYPGILVLQGPKYALDHAVTTLKAMKWQAMQVRGEIECNDKLLKDGMHEVEKVAEIVEKMEELQLGDWCLSALRMK